MLFLKYNFIMKIEEGKLKTEEPWSQKKSIYKI